MDETTVLMDVLRELESSGPASARPRQPLPRVGTTSATSSANILERLAQMLGGIRPSAPPPPPAPPPPVIERPTRIFD